MKGPPRTQGQQGPETLPLPGTHVTLESYFDNLREEDLVRPHVQISESTPEGRADWEIREDHLIEAPSRVTPRDLKLSRFDEGHF